MRWYIVPIIAVDVPMADGSVGHAYYPGENRVRKDLGIPFVLHAAAPLNAPISALLGVGGLLVSLPAGWSSLTLSDARAYFEATTGHAPAPSEVF